VKSGLLLLQIKTTWIIESKISRVKEKRINTIVSEDSVFMAFINRLTDQDNVL